MPNLLWAFTRGEPPKPPSPSPPPMELVDEPPRNTVLGNSPLIHKAHSSPWLQRIAVILPFIIVFNFLVAFKLDYNLPGSWWAVTVPLFVVQGFFAVLVLLYILRIHLVFAERFRIDVPNEATIAAEFMEMLFIAAMFTIESTSIPLIQHNADYSWGVAFIPGYVIGVAFLVYYTVAYLQLPILTRSAHYARHPISKGDALGRGAVAILFLIFLSLLALRLDDTWHVWTIVLLSPVILAGVVALRWMYEYSMSKDVRQVTGLQLMTVAVFIIVTSMGIVFLILRIDDHIDWPWFAVLSPLIFGEIVLWLTFCVWIWLARLVMPHKSIEAMQVEHEKTGDLPRQVDVYEEEEDTRYLEDL